MVGSLVLQYPDWQNGKIRLLATTKDRKALLAFKQAVIEEAKLNLIGCDDEVLRIEYEEELHKLEKLLNAIIPDESIGGKKQGGADDR
jgi:hypothetical protein